MNTNSTKIIIATAIISIAIGAAGAMAFSAMKDKKMSGMQSGGHMMPDGTMMGGSMGMQMEMEMDAMMQNLNGKTGDAFDKAFLSEMIMHHQGAVDMAEAALRDAKHQEIKDLAQRIITAQEEEVLQMRTWEKNWYGN
jgi:uncharacterized protein (DUF305 family)